MAYARLADLPTYYGLYAALLPPLVAALFGSSQQLATGPVAIVSLMTAASLAPLASAGSSAFIAYAIMLALIVGLIQLVLGVLKLGLVVNFISHPVVNGFTNASALIIASSQLPTLLGLRVDQAPRYYETIVRVAAVAWTWTHLPTLLFGVFAFLTMLLLKRRWPHGPYVLVAVAAATLLSWAGGFEQDRDTALEEIVSPRALEKIEEYNQALKSSAAHLAQTTELTGRIFELAGKPEQSQRVLELRHQVEMNSFLAQQAKEAASSHRHELRAFRFKAWENGEDRAVFALKDDPTLQGRPISGAWRLEPGNGPLDLKKLPLRAGGEVVGAIPPGLPALELPELDLRVLPQLISYALIISLLGFMEAVSVAKAMAAQTGQRLDPNKELIGQGMGNIAGSLSGGFPVAGSFSRSAVNLQAGARTFLSGVFSSLAVALVLIFFTPLLYHLPLSVLAAVIMLAVVGLVNVSGIVHAWRAQKHDGVIAVVSFAATLAFAPHLDRGILIGAGLSLLVFLYHSMRPRVALLALGDDNAFHDAPDHGLDLCDRIAVVRFDGPLFYANAAFLEDKIAEQRRRMPNLRHILLVCEGMNEMDASGEESLSLVVDRVRRAGHKISLAAVHLNVLRTMERTHLLAKIGKQNIYPTVADAVAAIHRDAPPGPEGRGGLPPPASLSPGQRLRGERLFR